jgi:hypothetical protein
VGTLLAPVYGRHAREREANVRGRRIEEQADRPGQLRVGVVAVGPARRHTRYDTRKAASKTASKTASKAASKTASKTATGGERRARHRHMRG